MCLRCLQLLKPYLGTVETMPVDDCLGADLCIPRCKQKYVVIKVADASIEP